MHPPWKQCPHRPGGTNVAVACRCGIRRPRGRIPKGRFALLSTSKETLISSGCPGGLPMMIQKRPNKPTWCLRDESRQERPPLRQRHPHRRYPIPREVRPEGGPIRIRPGSRIEITRRCPSTSDQQSLRDHLLRDHPLGNNKPTRCRHSPEIPTNRAPPPGDRHLRLSSERGR